MKKLILSFVLASVQIVGAQAQMPEARAIDFDKLGADTTGWHLRGSAGLTASQVSLNHWSAGGEGSLAVDAMFNYDADYTSGRHLWQNRLELAYGISNTLSRGVRKTNDKIFLTSMYGRRIAPKWYASALGVFATQFARGWNYSTSPRTYLSRFMSPGYVGLGAGITWRPEKWFSLYISPATWRATIVTDRLLFQDASGNMIYSPYGVKPGHRIRNEFGANLRAELDRDFWKRLHVYSRLDLFSNYLHKPQNIDVRWYTQLTARITRWLAASASVTLLYDDDIRFLRGDGTMDSPHLQVKQLLGLSLQTTF